MKKLLFIVLVILLGSTAGSTQIEATTTEGKKVYLYDDGSWEYAGKEEPTTEEVVKSGCAYTVNEVDEFTGKRKISLEPTVIGTTSTGTNLWLSLRRAGHLYAMFLEAKDVDLGCIRQNKSKVVIKFQDGQVYEFCHIDEDVCDGNLRFFSMVVPGDVSQMKNSDIKGLQDEMVKRFKETPIEALRVRGEAFYTDVELTKVGKTFFVTHMGCLE
jgi:hypothetical protein